MAEGVGGEWWNRWAVNTERREWGGGTLQAAGHPVSSLGRTAFTGSLGQGAVACTVAWRVNPCGKGVADHYLEEQPLLGAGAHTGSSPSHHPPASNGKLPHPRGVAEHRMTESPELCLWDRASSSLPSPLHPLSKSAGPRAALGCPCSCQLMRIAGQPTPLCGCCSAPCLTQQPKHLLSFPTFPSFAARVFTCGAVRAAPRPP